MIKEERIEWYKMAFVREKGSLGSILRRYFSAKILYYIVF